ncbi:MAG TPA: GNAT family N-acetyltransferase [Corynebacterium nuruki]|jgi:GNAT superfamily N-acetyltransferase|uniref:GNAT family N-acetyltransferase n=1 Tax=Corynebacterium nuruki TaxID=1032851 RepID=A0A3D4T2K5_9CORY|nr:GNAT family N-acetyltransferase [Corynebacterium nuruki]
MRSVVWNTAPPEVDLWHDGTVQNTISVTAVTPRDFLFRIDDLVDLHLTAMGYDRAAFHQRRLLWSSNARNRGFTGVVALEHPDGTTPDPADPSQRVVGVAYGFPGFRTSWWYREVHRGLRGSGLDAGQAGAVLADYDEVSEVHVLPEFQGHRIGHRMLAQLLPRLTSATAMLSTPEVPDEGNAAWGLYRALGFRDVLRNFRFTSDDRPFGILARPRGDVPD